MYDTPSLNSAYSLFGNVADVKGWFKAECFKAPMRPVPPKVPKVVKTKLLKPIFWEPCIKLEYRPLERLDLSKTPDLFLLTIDGEYPKDQSQPLSIIEKMARKKPSKDWRIELIETFRSYTYQRQGRNKWLLIEIGKGYA
jgi:hypothetical protein